MTTKPTNPSEKEKSAASVLAKIETLISQRRAPFLAGKRAVTDLAVHVSELEQLTASYIEKPTPERFQVALTAETELIASRSFLERLPDFDIAPALTFVLDESTEQAAPLFLELAEINAVFIDQCKLRLKEFRIAAADTTVPDQLLEMQLKVYATQITDADQTNQKARQWTLSWASKDPGNGSGPSALWAFWPIYHALKKPELTLYATTAEMPVPPNYQPPFVPIAMGPATGSRVLVPSNEPEEGEGFLNTSSVKFR